MEAQRRTQNANENMICVKQPNPNPLVPFVQEEEKEKCDARSRLDYIVYARYSNLTPTTQNALAGTSNADYTASAAREVPIAARASGASTLGTLARTAAALRTSMHQCVQQDTLSSTLCRHRGGMRH